MAKIPDTAALIEMFNKINKDCTETGESVVALTDVDFYAEQIGNIYEPVSAKKARQAAEAMAEHVKGQRVEEARALLMAEFADDEITEGHYTTAFDGYLEEHEDRFGQSAGKFYETAAEIVADFHAYMKWAYK